MTAARTRKRPGAGPASRSASANNARGSFYHKGPPPRLPDNWRSRLPDPESYYRKHVKKLGKPNGKGWAPCLCPFHDDHHPSAGVNFLHGGFKCQVCDKHHDLVGFHEAITGLKFPNSARDLIGLRS